MQNEHTDNTSPPAEITPPPARFLVFTLYAPIAAFGSTPMGVNRPSWPRPGRAAVLGLVGAALGIVRDDEDAHLGLDASLHYAVRTDTAGTPLDDYHTTQAPGRRKPDWRTRREQLRLTDEYADTAGNSRLPTILSTRGYRTDCLFTAVLWPRSDAGETGIVDDIASAMRSPAFTPYLGRKAAPLGLPLNPQIIEAASFLHALTMYTPGAPAHDILHRIGNHDEAAVAVDADAPEVPAGTEIHRRTDRLTSRARWQYQERDEAVFTLPR